MCEYCEEKEDISNKFKMQRDNEEDSVYAIKFAVMQQQIDEKDKRIKELEEENRIYVLNGNNVKLEIYIKDNYMPKQKVKDAELEKKDKIINLMAEFIDVELSSLRLGRILNRNVKPLESYKEYIKQYFERRSKE